MSELTREAVEAALAQLTTRARRAPFDGYGVGAMFIIDEARDTLLTLMDERDAALAEKAKLEAVVEAVRSDVVAVCRKQPRWSFAPWYPCGVCALENVCAAIAALDKEANND